MGEVFEPVRDAARKSASDVGKVVDKLLAPVTPFNYLLNDRQPVRSMGKDFLRGLLAAPLLPFQLLGRGAIGVTQATLRAAINVLLSLPAIPIPGRG